MRTESGLFEEARYELVILHIVDVLLLQGSFSASNFEAELSVHIIGRVLFIAVLFLRHFWSPRGGGLLVRSLKDDPQNRGFDTKFTGTFVPWLIR